MPKIKKARVPVMIDMTPMVDVAFLLLTFFMLTTQFKPAEEVEIILPSSRSEAKLPETDVMTISVDSTKRIFLGFDSQRAMVRMFGNDYKLRKSAETSIEKLPDQLIQARMSNPKLRTVIRGDKNVDYGVVSDVMDILQKTQITRFSMITNFKETKK